MRRFGSRRDRRQLCQQRSRGRAHLGRARRGQGSSSSPSPARGTSRAKKSEVSPKSGARSGAAASQVDSASRAGPWRQLAPALCTCSCRAGGVKQRCGRQSHGRAGAGGGLWEPLARPPCPSGLCWSRVPGLPGGHCRAPLLRAHGVICVAGCHQKAIKFQAWGGVKDDLFCCCCALFILSQPFLRARLSPAVLGTRNRSRLWLLKGASTDIWRTG